MRSEPEMKGVVDSIQRLAKRAIIGITPPLVTDFIRKVMPGLGVSPSLIQVREQRP